MVLGLSLAALAGCASTPRGAALQREILAEAEETDASGAAPFTVEPVTRDRIGLYAGWPAVGEPGLGWPGRADRLRNRMLAAGDRVTVTLWNTEENGLLNAPGQRSVAIPAVQLSSGGSVFLPYVGEVTLAGMTPEAARSLLEERFASVAPGAQVQLEMAEGRQNTVSLVAGVGSPGSYPLPDRDYSLLNLLADGGGVPPTLANPQIRLQRGNAIYGISLAALTADPARDIRLSGGDKIVVEADKRTFLSLGAAGRRSVHDFDREKITALDALSIIGGVIDSRADAGGILILRQYPAAAVRSDGSGPANARTVFSIDLTSADGLFSAGQFQIRSGDLVYVTESPITRLQAIFGIFGSSLGLASQASNIGN